MLRLRIVLLALVLLPGCEGVLSNAPGEGSVDASARRDATAPADARPANVPPVASFEVTRGASASARSFDGSASSDADGEIVEHRWELGDLETATGALVDHEYTSPGCITVTLTVTDDRGGVGMATRQIVIAGSAENPTVATLDPLPRNGALLPRDVATNDATLVVSGSVTSAGWEEARVRVLRDGVEDEVLTAPICDGRFSLDVVFPAELASRDVRVFLGAGEREEELGAVTDLVAGDVILIQGQSNAVATMYGGSANANVTPFVRSFGTRDESASTSAGDDQWRPAEGDAADGPAAIGQWALRMGKLLVEETGVPIAILNGARGGQPIEYFARNDASPASTSTNYGRLLERTQRAGLTDAVRAIMFYQGESDGGRAEIHRAGFTALHEDWRVDFPNVERFYVVQVRKGCGDPSIPLRNHQRQFAETLPRTTVMAATALDAHDGCHYRYENGYRQLGERFARLLGRDLFGVAPQPDTDAIDVAGARLEGDTLTIETRSDASAITVQDGARADFALAGTARTTTAVRAVGTNLELTLSAGTGAPTAVSYDGHPGAGPWVTNATGVGMLAFTLPVE